MYPDIFERKYQGTYREIPGYGWAIFGLWFYQSSSCETAASISRFPDMGGPFLGYGSINHHSVKLQHPSV